MSKGRQKQLDQLMRDIRIYLEFMEIAKGKS